MLTKRDVNAWVERREQEVLDSVSAEYKQRRLDEEERIMTENGAMEAIERMKKLVAQMRAENEGLINLLLECPEIREYSKYGYGGISKTISNLGNLRFLLWEYTKFQSPELARLEKVYDETQRAVKANYAAVKAEIKSKGNAKRCLDYLKELGFDVAQLEALAEDHTEIAIEVDKRYLFSGLRTQVNKEEK